MSVLEVKNLTKSYKTGFLLRSSEVLTDVSFSLDSGKITGFLGGNGAGKTTTIKCILNLCYPDSGDIHFFNDQKLNTEILKRIGFLPERPYFYEYLTGQEFLVFYGQLSTSLSKKDLKLRSDSILKKVHLFHAKNKILREYSKGMLQKIGLAQALMHDPELVILDEPMSGLDPDGRAAMAGLIKDVAGQGRAVFFSSHLLHDVQRMCDDLVILSEGQIVYRGGTTDFVTKAGSGFLLSTFKDGQIDQEEVQDNEGLQKRIGELLSSGAQIREVRPLHASLEEAFVDIAIKKDSDL